ncbi:MAG: hypothetical protein ACTHWZ_07835 [Peptoniphilaceae bacterium]
MNKLNKWKSREILSNKVLFLVLIASIIIKFLPKINIYNNISLTSLSLVIINSCILVVIFTNAMHLIESKDFSYKNISSVILNILTFVFFMYLLFTE